jgi:hypothetical protein
MGRTVPVVSITVVPNSRPGTVTEFVRRLTFRTRRVASVTG